MIESLLQPASCDLKFVKFEGPVILVIPVLIAALAAVILPFNWAYKGAERQGKNGLCLLILLVITGYPLSFVRWFWLRPINRA